MKQIPSYIKPIKLTYNQKGVVSVFDTPPTQTHGGCVHDAVSDTF